MKKSKDLTLMIMIIIALILQACVTTTITADPTPTAPPPASTPALITGSQPPEPTGKTEIESGAVFIIPEYWLRFATPIAQPTATQTTRPQKGRSNYQ